MCDDPDSPDGIQVTRDRLARISDALGIPVMVFLGGEAASDAREELRRRQEMQVLTLVQAYLRAVDRDAGRRFAESVQAMMEAEAR